VSDTNGVKVGLAERFRVEASRHQEGGEGVTEEESNAFNNYLLSLGIATPVTKQSAGALFHSELARQLCDFMAKPLQHAGGNMSLADVYCLFNRARGTGRFILPSSTRLYDAHRTLSHVSCFVCRVRLLVQS
jgi:hypothetical protein